MCDYGSDDGDDGWEDPDDHVDYGDEDYGDVSIGEGVSDLFITRVDVWPARALVSYPD